MKFIKNYIAYLKDNPEGYWFKRKLYGYGWTPATREGWTVLGVFVVSIVLIAIRGESITSGEAVLKQVVLPMLGLTFLLIYITYKTGESLAWSWGQPNRVVMHLDQSPFLQIQSGQKSIEVRINDEKRATLRVGDHIEFVSRADPTQKISKRVNQLSTFKTFEDLFARFPDERTEIYKYYTKADEDKFGVVAIKLT